MAERSISSEYRIQDTELEQGCSTDTEREELNSAVVCSTPWGGVEGEERIVGGSALTHR